MGPELQAADPGRGERQSDEWIDAAALERLRQPHGVEAEVVEVVDDRAEAFQGKRAESDADAHLHGTMMYQMVSVDEVRAFALQLPRAYEVLVRDRVKFRVGRIVFVAFSRDETLMGFGFPREERAALVASEPEKFLLPEPSDMRYQWVVVRLAAIDVDEMHELVLDAWRMCVPKKVSALVP